MDLRAILFDVNSTLVDIETDEGRIDLRHHQPVLDLSGRHWPPDALRDRYFQLMTEQRRGSREPYPEFDAVAIWRTLLQEAAGARSSRCRPKNAASCPCFWPSSTARWRGERLASTPMSATCSTTLAAGYALGVVTDAQSAYARARARRRWAGRRLRRDHRLRRLRLPQAGPAPVRRGARRPSTPARIRRSTSATTCTAISSARSKRACAPSSGRRSMARKPTATSRPTTSSTALRSYVRRWRFWPPAGATAPDRYGPGHAGPAPLRASLRPSSSRACRLGRAPIQAFSAAGLQLAPAAGPIVGNDLLEYRQQRGPVERFALRIATVRAVLFVCPPVIIPAGSGTIPPS